MCLFPAILYLLSVPLICISLLLVFFLFFVRLFFLLLNFGILGVLTYYKEWMTLSGAPARSVIPRQPLNSPSLNDWKVFSDWYTIGNRLINEVTTFPSLCCLLIDYAREHQFQVSLKCQPSLRPFPPLPPKRRPWSHLSSIGTKTAYQRYIPVHFGKLACPN